MQRALVIFGIVVMLFAPIAMLVFRHPVANRYIRSVLRIPTKVQVSDQYIVVNEARTSTLKLVDTAYLDYVAANLGIFKDQAIVDPRAYRGFPDIQNKYTVSRVQFILVDDMDAFVYASSGKKAFASKGDYRIVNDTLEVSISLNNDEFTQGPLNKQFVLEETFLKTAFVTLLYAHGMSTPLETARVLEKIKTDMKEYLQTGIFAWPIRIEEEQ